MSNYNPRVTVGMPVYNAETFLAESIESILGQTFSDFRLVISDNASTDETESICRSYASMDKRILYFRNDSNLGAAKNYNRVFEGCDTEYFKWAASDDLCDPSYLSRCVEVLDREPDVVLCYGKTKIIDANGDVIDCYEDGLNLISSSAGGRYLQLKYNLGKCNALCGVIRSDVLRSTRLIGNFIGSDECLLAELALLGKFREHPEYLFLRRDHPGSSSANKDIASQLQFFDPSLNGKIVLREWRHLFENLMSIRRAPVRLSQKVEPMFFLLGSSLINGKQYLRELTVALKQFVKSRQARPRQNGN